MEHYGTTSLFAATSRCPELRALFSEEWFFSRVSPSLLSSSLFLESSDKHVWQGVSGGIFCVWFHEQAATQLKDEDFNDDHWFHVPKKIKKQVISNSKLVLESVKDPVSNLSMEDLHEFTIHKVHFAHPSDEAVPSVVSCVKTFEKKDTGFSPDRTLNKAAGTQGPEESFKQPASGTPGPDKKVKQPASGTPGPDKQPASGSQEPDKTTKQPASGTPEPDNQPASGTQEPDKQPTDESSELDKEVKAGWCTDRPFSGPPRACSFSFPSSHGGGRVDFLELFSPPRVSVEAKKRGLVVSEPEAFDLETGWDFFNAHDRAFFWKVVREQEPLVIGMSPKCTAFSTMMESNWSRMNGECAQEIQEEGKSMLQFCIQVAIYQLERGRYFYLEHPGFASSWATHSMRWLLSFTSVFLILFDQCMAGLSVSPDTVSRKTTGLATNHLGVAAIVSQFQCDGNHQHLQLQSGLPRKAQQYPVRLVAALVKGLMWKNLKESFVEGVAEEDEADLEEMLDREVDPPPVVSQVSETLTEQQKQKVHKVHSNMGHLAPNKMMVMFKAAGALPAVLKYIKEEFKCSQCMKQQKPIEARRAAFPRTFAFNRFLGVDCFYIPFQNKTV